ncbi:hypothetical protein MBM09_07575 [Flaviramulus sp. BrNp1-15]|uniref:imm11 family protein n=1 Tax=Flaviramulus sp. BrNp1-15 TaxID=2916754 RepID=UPI001EE7D21B|nr:DUF1629 domain-containing protein [Flaviramulus sp. BrNp1-15]ULC60850.1 hypothetical protein MBM09_07575 [Flaviramulus sp. BrNp1-15]
MDIYKLSLPDNIVDIVFIHVKDKIKPKHYLWNKFPVLENWERLPVELDEYDDKGKKLKRVDFLGTSSTHLIIDTHVKKIILPIVKDYGEFLPLYHNSEDFWIFNVTNIIDAINFELSEQRFPEEDINYESPNLSKAVMYKSKVENGFIFRVPQKNYYDTYFTQSFIDEILKLNLIGFTYKRAATAV